MLGCAGKQQRVPRASRGGLSAAATGCACEPDGKSPPGPGTRCSKCALWPATVRKTFSCSLPVHYENPLKGAFRTTKPFKRILSTQKQHWQQLPLKVLESSNSETCFLIFFFLTFQTRSTTRLQRNVFCNCITVRKCIVRLMHITVIKTICKSILHKMVIKRYGPLPQ